MTSYILRQSSVLQLSAFVFLDSPKITLAPKDHKVMDGGIVSFLCKASGNPAPDVIWKRNDKRITARQTRYTIFNMPHGSVLRIDPVRAKRDDGTVECVAENGIGESASASATLEVYAEGLGESLMSFVLWLKNTTDNTSFSGGAMLQRSIS